MQSLNVEASTEKPTSNKGGEEEKLFYPKCRGMLYVYDDEIKEYRGNYYVCQKDSLISYAGRYKRKVISELKVRFTVLELVNVFPDDKFSHGFSLRTHEKVQTFYLSSLIELDQWTESLRRYCYLTGFEQKYQILREIDRGKTSVINLIQDIKTGEHFAGKFIPKESFISKPSRLKLVKNEIKAMSTFQSSHILTLHEFYQTDTEIIIVMEYIEHGTLFHRIMSKKKYTEKEGAILIRNLMEGLCLIHSQKILHRDIKLENIFMSSSNNDVSIKIGDFDLACTPEDSEPTKLFGTPGYIAPEIFTKAPGCYSEKSDVFSSGIVLYTILFGSFPFKGKTSKELMEANKACALKLSGSKWRRVSPECQEILTKMLEVDPKARFDPLAIINHKWVKMNTFDESGLYVMSTSGPSKIHKADGNPFDLSQKDDYAADNMDDDEYYILMKNSNIQKHRIGRNQTKLSVLVPMGRAKSLFYRPRIENNDDHDTKTVRERGSFMLNPGTNRERTSRKIDDNISKNSNVESNYTLHPFYGKMSGISVNTSPQRKGDNTPVGEVSSISENIKKSKSEHKTVDLNHRVLRGQDDSFIGSSEYRSKPYQQILSLKEFPTKFLKDLR